MKHPIFDIFKALIFLQFIVINGASWCFDDYKDEFPEWLKLWKDPKYGIEFTGPTTMKNDLGRWDSWAQSYAADKGPAKMKKEVDKLISDNIEAGFPDFTITKLDPISYNFNKQKMWITFKNVKLRNLDTYNRNTAKYTQTALNERGPYKMDKEMYDRVEKNRGLRKRTEADKKNHNYVLERKDVQWTINISANFETHQIPESRPIIIETEFKIQPDTEHNEEAETDEIPLRASGLITFEFHDLSFKIGLVITHIDDPLRPYFDPKKFCGNRVPDFDVSYAMKELVIKKNTLRLTKYDDDEVITQINQNEENINENVPIEEQWKKQHEYEKKNKIEEPSNFIEDDNNLTEKIIQHLNVLKEDILENQEKIRKKMCLNLLPKMTWKVMRMKTKKQLPFLFKEIIAYDDAFHPKVELPPAGLLGAILGDFSEGVGNCVKGMCKMFNLNRSVSDPGPDRKGAN